MSKDDALTALVNLVKMKSDAAIVVDGNADDIIEQLVADGWTLKDEVDYLLGKRIRHLIPPPGTFERYDSGETS